MGIGIDTSVNAEGVQGTYLSQNTVVVTEKEKTAEIKKTEISDDKKRIDRSEASVYRNLEYDRWMIPAEKFYDGKLSEAEFKEETKNLIQRMYEMSTTNGWIDDATQVKSLNSMYCSMILQSRQFAVNANRYEGEKIDKKTATGSNSKYTYYNAKFYYLYEDTRRVIGECFNEFAEEKDIGELNNEEYYARNMKKGSDNYNSCWRANTRNNKMVNIEVAPPKGFSFFYRETHESLSYEEWLRTPYVMATETRRFLLVDGVEINGKGQLKLEETVGDARLYTTAFDFAKSFLQKKELLLKNLRYLQNFSVIQLFNL